MKKSALRFQLLIKLIKIGLVSFTVFSSLPCKADDDADDSDSSSTQEVSQSDAVTRRAPSNQATNNSQSDAQTASESPGPTRNYYDVLEDLLADFEYDLKDGSVGGLKNISIRNISLSENIPSSYRSHLELILTERILKTSKTRVLQCLPCKAKKSTLLKDQVIISSPDNNSQELARIAKDAGIEHFLDASFSFQSNGMILSMAVSDPENGNIIWSRSYNSENSRASIFRRGVDYKQVDEARRMNEYLPLIQHRLSLYYLSLPNLPQASGNLILGYRAMERYSNRKKEVGFELNYAADAGTVVDKINVSPYNLYTAFGFNIALLFMHAWNFIGEEENYNQVRNSLSIGIGGAFTSGYLSGIIRSSYEWRLAKHFGFSLNLGYRPQASVLLINKTTTSLSGIEFGLGVSYLF